MKKLLNTLTSKVSLYVNMVILTLMIAGSNIRCMYMVWQSHSVPSTWCWVNLLMFGMVIVMDFAMIKDNDKDVE